ncbi:UNVERIFIED_CONTAM: hypothetical protein PYX00_010863 [Menopon gallinae]|uniref:Reverse transcriptase n=1 Tax=Menopon gallinae TaxID=328185 RepID=A0AAW2H6U5_9NEOP
MRNLAGPSYWCRRLYATALESIALYGSPVWAEATAKNRKIERKIAAAQKIIAIRTIRGYRTIGADAAMVMACRPPIPVAAAARSSVMTQIISGHGSFPAFLAKIGKRESPKCTYCEAERDDADHTLATCPRWETERRDLKAVIGENLSLPVVVSTMVSREEAWEAVRIFSERVMLKKEQDERRENRESGPFPRTSARTRGLTEERRENGRRQACG